MSMGEYISTRRCDSFDSILENYQEDDSISARIDRMLRVVLGRDSKREEGEPNISIEIINARHLSMKDVWNLKKKIKKSSIFIPEHIGWNPAYKKKLQEVASGNNRPAMEFDPYETSRPALYEYALQEALYKSKTIVEFIDIPEDYSSSDTPYRRYVNKVAGYEQLESEIWAHMFFAPLDAIVERIQAETAVYADAQKEREEYMVSRLKDLIERIKEENNDHDTHIVIQLGTSHSGVYHALRRSGESVQRTIDTSPDGTTSYPPTTILWRKYRFFQSVSREDCVRRFFLLSLPRSTIRILPPSLRKKRQWMIAHTLLRIVSPALHQTNFPRFMKRCVRLRFSQRNQVNATTLHLSSEHVCSWTISL